MGNKCLVEVAYRCYYLEKGGRGNWFIMSEEEIPKSRCFAFSLWPDEETKKQMPLPPNDCGRYTSSQMCEADLTCNFQDVLQVLPYTEEDAKRLNARQLEVKIRKESWRDAI